MEQDLSTYKLTYRNIVETALVALSSDPAIREWCVAEYGFPPMVANDADPMDPPQERDCPYISVTPLGGENGQDDATFSRAFLVRCAVSDTRKLDDVDPVTGRVLSRRLVGTEKISHLLENLIYPCIRAAFNAKNYAVSTVDEAMENPNLSLFQARAGLTIRFDKAIGEEVPFLP